MRLQGFINLFSYFCTEIKVKFMNSKKPLILISNDDGYHSNGIRTLVSFLTDFADVVVCAPCDRHLHGNARGELYLIKVQHPQDRQW